MKNKLVTFILLFVVVATQAQQAIDTSKKIFVATEVEVKAIRASSKAPFTKTNFTKEDIAKNNLGQDIPFLLNQTPSVIINSDAGNGVGYTGIRIRGTDATRINMTINGIPYNDAESQGIFFVNLPDLASSVTSLQVQRGVGSSSNGAGAFGATMSFSTNEKNEKASIELNNSYGSFNTVKNTLKLSSGLLSNHVTIDGRLSQIKSEGYIDRATTNLQSDMLTIGYYQHKTNLKLNVIAGKEKTYQAWYGVGEAQLKTERTFNSAGTEQPTNPYDNETDNYNQNHYQLILNHQFSKELNFSTASFYTSGKGYYEQYKASQKYSKYGLPNVGATTKTDLIRQLWLDNHFYGQTFSLLYNKKQSSFTVGGMISKYEGNHFGQVIWSALGIPKNYKWYDLDATKTDANIYAKWQYDVDTHWSTYLDIQNRGVTYKIGGFRNNPTVKVDTKYNFTNPKLGLSYVDLKSDSKASVSYAKSSKEPNREDFEANITNAPKLETLHDVELNLSKKINKITLSATGYVMSYDNQLILTGKVNDVGAYTRENIKNSYRAGVELVFTYKPISQLEVEGNVTVSKNKIKNFTEYFDDYDNGGQKSITHNNTNIAFSPTIIAGAIVTIAPTNSFNIRLLEKYVGKQYLDNTQNDTRKLNPYFLQDAMMSYSPNFKKINGCTILFQVNNILNKLYEPNGYTFSYVAGGSVTTENFYYPMAGRNFMVGLNIKL
jgi:iron complex outermembrane recepter protein